MTRLRNTEQAAFEAEFLVDGEPVPSGECTITRARVVVHFVGEDLNPISPNGRHDIVVMLYGKSGLAIPELYTPEAAALAAQAESRAIEMLRDGVEGMN